MIKITRESKLNRWCDTLHVFVLVLCVRSKETFRLFSTCFDFGRRNAKPSCLILQLLSELPTMSAYEHWHICSFPRGRHKITSNCCYILAYLLVRIFRFILIVYQQWLKNACFRREGKRTRTIQFNVGESSSSLQISQRPDLWIEEPFTLIGIFVSIHAFY